MGDYCKFAATKNTNMAWKYFAPIVNNNFGTAGLIAGLYLRSECDPYFGYSNYLGDEVIDMRTFVLDKKGFGMGKWKNWIRKQSIYNFCRRAGKPLYDIDTQMAFIMDEFSGTTRGPVLLELKDATSVKEAAYLVYDKYLDIRKHDDEKREICAELALDIYATYGMPNELKAPVKYVKTNGKRVRAKGPKGKTIPFIRKTLGYLRPDEIYRFITMSDDGNEYAVYFGDDVGYVNSEKTHIVTRMEAMK